MHLRPLLLPCLALLLAGCSGLAPDTALAPPQVRLTDIRITELGPSEQRYRLELEVHNPNRFAVPIAGLVYRLTINGEPFGRGASDRPVELAANGDTRLSVELVNRTEDLLQQLQRLAEGGGDTLDYALFGEVRLRGRRDPVPFGSEGSLGSAAPRGTAI
jgi:LEA14-like dessication related protein